MNWSLAEGSEAHTGIVNANGEHCDAPSHTRTVCVEPTLAPDCAIPYFWVPNANSFGTMADGLQPPGKEPLEQGCGSEAQTPVAKPVPGFKICILKGGDVGHVLGSTVDTTAEMLSKEPV